MGVLKGEYYKVGITQRTIKTRFSGYPAYTVIMQLEGLSLKDALVKEKEWLLNVKEFKYTPNNLPAGKTECFKY